MKYLNIGLVKFLFIGLFVISFSSCTEEVNPVQQKLEQLVVQNQVPGINFSIIKDGVQEDFSAGFADTIDKVDLTPNHVLFSGSIGKTYAVAVLMQLVDEGKVNLNEKFISYFPEVEWLKNLPNIDDFTVEMLLQHTSGLPRYVYVESVWESLIEDPDKVWSYEDRLSYTYEMEPVHEAGKGWAYSDTGYILIGMLIEEVTENDYYDEVDERILSVKNLSNTHPAIRRDIPNLATGYSEFGVFKGKNMVVDGIYIFNPQMEWTGGGIACSTPELAKWAEIYFAGDLFSDSLMNKIVEINPNGKDIDENLSYGMGSFTYNTKYGKAYGHSGTFPGYKSIFAYFPEKDISVALQVNCDFATEKMGLVEYLEEVLSTVI